MKDKKASAYLVYEKIQPFQRPTEMNIVDYINEFERLYNEIERYEMTLPTAVLAYRVLESASISNEKQQLVKATITKLNYKNMKKLLKAIHDSFPVHYENNSTRGRFSNYKRSNSNSKQWKYNNPGTQHKSMNTDKYGQKTNPINGNGNITKSSICHSICHWYKECPHKIDDADGNQVKLNLFSKEVYNCYTNKFVGETFNHAVLGSGRTKTVCGESWLNNYIDTVSANDKQKVVESKSDTKFKFEDGNTVPAIKEVKIPAQIRNKEVDITQML